MPPSISPTLVVIAVLFGVLGVLQGIYVYIQRNGTRNPRRIDGDRIYADDRMNELLHARPPSAPDEQADHADGPGAPAIDATNAVRCPNCQRRNQTEFDFCRHCVAELPA